MAQLDRRPQFHLIMRTRTFGILLMVIGRKIDLLARRYPLRNPIGGHSDWVRGRLTIRQFDRLIWLIEEELHRKAPRKHLVSWLLTSSVDLEIRLRLITGVAYQLRLTEPARGKCPVRHAGGAFTTPQLRRLLDALKRERRSVIRRIMTRNRSSLPLAPIL